MWDDRILLTTAYSGGQRLSLLAYRRSDGELLWESFAPDGRSERVHQKNGHASATPTTDGERIYVSFGARGLMAFSMDGDLLWRQDVGQISNYHGTAGSPLVYRDRIIIFQDHASGSFVAAFDSGTGEELWRPPVKRASAGVHRLPFTLRIMTRSSYTASVGFRLMIRIRDWSCGDATETLSK